MGANFWKKGKWKWTQLECFWWQCSFSESVEVCTNWPGYLVIKKIKINKRRLVSLRSALSYTSPLHIHPLDLLYQKVLVFLFLCISGCKMVIKTFFCDHAVENMRVKYRVFGCIRFGLSYPSVLLFVGPSKTQSLSKQFIS